ncbi:MAG: ATP-binding cassette domain-containing protein [Paludibacter sp.]
MIKKNLPVILSILFLLIIWQLIAYTVNYSAIFPSVFDLFKNSFELLGNQFFYMSLLVTILRGILGFLLSYIVAITLATLASQNLFFKQFFQPIIVTFRSIPVISVVLVALLWFSPPVLPVFIAFLTMFPILYQSVLSGFQAVDTKLIEMSTLFGKTKWHTYIHILLPASKMQIFGGISTATGFGWRAIIIGEALAQPISGIGTGMKMAQVYLNVSELFAWTLLAIAISYVFDKIVWKIANSAYIYNYHISNMHKNTNKPNNSIKTLKFSAITKSFQSNMIFEKMNYEFDSNKVYLLKAPSGKGKSTLLMLASGLLSMDEGVINQSNIHSKAYSFQDHRLCGWLKVIDNINYPLSKKQLSNSNYHTLNQEVINKLEIADLLNKYPNELSGGELQRVTLARALVAKSDLLLLDEPLNGLDAELKLRIMKYLGDYIIAHKPLVLWATHEEIKMDGIELENVSF